MDYSKIEQCSEFSNSEGALLDGEDREYWHKLCYLGELGWGWDSVYHFLKTKNGELRFMDIDEAIEATRELLSEREQK